MNRSIGIAVLFLIAAALYRKTRSVDPWAQVYDGSGQLPGNEQPSALENLVNTVSEAFGMLKISSMKNVDRSLLNNPNVQAFLRVIRSRESSQSPDAYRMIVGGGFFNDFSDHPRIKGLCWTTKDGKRLCSTAAGAYQITATTYDEAKRLMNIPDFSPQSQDLIALGRIAARGALDDVLAGRLDAAIPKLKLEWEAFSRWPDTSFYKNVFAQYGGALSQTRVT